MNNPPPPPWKKEDKYDNTHLLDERTEDQRNTNDFLELIELGSLRVRTTQLSGLPDECSLFPSPAICSTMDLIPPQAFIGNVPTSGFQGPMGFAHPTSRVTAPIFIKTSWQRGCVWVSGWAAPAGGTLSWGLCAPRGGSLHWGACPLSPARLCVAVCRCLWPPTCRQTASDPRGAVSVSPNSTAREH